MDPVSAISATLSLFSAISQLNGLWVQYKDAPKEVEDTWKQCNDTKSMLTLVRESIQIHQSAIDQSRNSAIYMDLLGSSTQGIKSCLRKIKKELPKLDAKNASKLGRWENAKFLWNADFFKSQLEAIQKHHNNIIFVNSFILGLAVKYATSIFSYSVFRLANTQSTDRP